MLQVQFIVGILLLCFKKGFENSACSLCSRILVSTLHAEAEVCLRSLEFVAN